ncbi:MULTISPECIES: YhgE/Pip family protein [Streptomyces]|uniref:YhgE/Pip domain-containing protein n=1 Tax=Streptomyces morookaense TaxID=1970 RepID=A0A7Y7B634_STRMO|nr:MULTISPECIES: YhgE/Pip domain-containing protein [Streptomyces]MCC2277045.1 YhgE/Pip domain-containing protein [Streptomyces sp. ET3-23]NVK79731.1 YhgE/Pip domain-containing protein [Streptomyces morookaense]GHF31889.1 membrane protein [Streptomyces morookaense]
MRSPKLAALELKRFGRGKLPRAALVALLLLPLLYGALYLWSFWDPYGRLDKVPVALVNDDRGATVDGKKLTAGDSIADGLHGSKSSFKWEETSAADARKGLESGKYYLSLTIPADFSKRVASSSGNSPETGALQVRTNDANNYIVGSISRTVFAEVRAAASRNASRSFYDKIFVSFSDLHNKTKQAADGADQLGDGIGKAEKGAGDLKNGLSQAKEGSGKLEDGVDKLHSGAGTLDAKSGDLADGAGQVAAGTKKLADAVNGAASSSDATYLKNNAADIGKMAGKVADEAGNVRQHLADLPTPKATAALVASSDLALTATKDAYAAFCEKATTQSNDGCTKLKKAVFAAEESKKSAQALDDLVNNKDGALDKLPAQLDALQSAAQKLHDKAPTLASDIDGAVREVNALNNGAQQVASGAAKLHNGAGQLHSGLGDAKDGVAGLDDGIGKLRNGADSLEGGMFKLSDGSSKLAGGLHDGVSRIPDYGKSDRDARTEVMADPVKLASQALHKAPNYGTGFAPYFIPLSLWVGAMVAYMLMQPLNRRALAAGAPAWRIALAGWLPVVAIGVLQVAALLSVLHWGLGLQMERAAGTVGFLVLVTACFASIVQWLNARFGPAGRILVLALLMLQLTSAGGTYPVQTSPGFFNAIHPYLPMSYVIEGLRRLISGGGLGPVWQACGVLAAFTVGALALTAWAARGKQVWSLDRLHPELSL